MILGTFLAKQEQSGTQGSSGEAIVKSITDLNKKLDSLLLKMK